MQSPVNFWAVSLGPPPNGRVIDGQSPLRHELFQIAQTQAKAQIPAHAGDDHLRFELAFPKQRRPTRLHGVTLPNPQVQHFPLDGHLRAYFAADGKISWDYDTARN